MDRNAKLIMVGGFLGAGKTTLLRHLAKYLSDAGKVVGFITNDQAENLIDSHLILKETDLVKEVSGSCFCCNYNGFVSAVDGIINGGRLVDMIIAEPVGSCTDISATILQPLKSKLGIDVQMSPYTVLADPERLEKILDNTKADLHPDAVYVYKKQLEEADVIAISKIDTISESTLDRLTKKAQMIFPGRPMFLMSAETGDGVRQWLDYIMENSWSGNRIVDIDYDVYARGEAVLGWMNASLMLRGTNIDWDLLLKNLFYQLNDLFKELYANVAHVKILIDASGDQFVIGNMTGDESTIRFRGTAGVGDASEMIINARVELSPRLLNKIIFDALSITVADEVFYEVRRSQYLQPGFPKPVHRYKNVIE